MQFQRIVPLLILAAAGSALAADNDYGAPRINPHAATNVRGLQDEQTHAKLTASEISVGLRYGV